MNDACILLSGGLDSSVLALHMQRQGFRCHPIFIHYQQQYAYRELTAAGVICRSLRLPQPLVMKTEMAICPLTTAEEVIPDNRTGVANSFVPGRNLQMLTMAASYAASCGIGTIAIGVTAEDQVQFPDCTPQFFATVSRLIWKHSFPGIRLLLLTPFIKMAKEQVIRLGAAKNMPLQKTWSCYTPREGVHCGKCHACRVRREGFARSGIKDYTEYYDEETEETRTDIE